MPRRALYEVARIRPEPREVLLEHAVAEVAQCPEHRLAWHEDLAGPRRGGVRVLEAIVGLRQPPTEQGGLRRHADPGGMRRQSTLQPVRSAAAAAGREDQSPLQRASPRAHRRMYIVARGSTRRWAELGARTDVEVVSQRLRVRHEA